MRRIFTVCALVLCAASAAAHPVSVKDWVRLPEFRNVVISPDGEYLAVVSSPKNSDIYQLVIVSTKSVLSGKPKVEKHFGLREYKLFSDVFWVNDKRLVAATAHQFGGFDRPDRDGNLYAMDVNGTNAKHLMGPNSGGELGYRTSGTNKEVYFAGLLSRLPSNKNLILIAGYPLNSNVLGAYLLDTVSDTFHRVTGGLYGGGMLADHKGVVRVIWGTDEKTGLERVEYRKPGAEGWTNAPMLAKSAPSAADAFVMSTGNFVVQEQQPIMFGPNNINVYFPDWTGDGAQTIGLFAFNTKTGQTKLVYDNKTVDVGIGEFSDTDPYIKSFDRKSLVGLRLMPGKIETRVLNAGAPRIQLLAALQHVFPNKATEIVSHTRDGSECIVKVWGDATPAVYYLYASKPKPNLTPLFSATPWIKPDDLSPTRPITYKSRDGLTIHGYLTVPRGAKAKDLPLVVYVHGGPHGIRYDWGFSADDFDALATQILANHGYAVLAPNYRGSGGYGLGFETAGYRHWGDTMQDDLADAVNWAIKQGVADPARVCIVGASYGGYAALMSVERFPDMYKCAVGYDGVYDLPMLKTRKSDIARFAAGRAMEDSFLGDDHKQLVAFSPAFHADRIKAAVFLLHGGRDERAPVAGYEEMVHAIRKHGTPLETLYERNEGHGFYKPAHRAKAWTDILAFLNKYIGPGAAADGGAKGGGAN